MDEQLIPCEVWSLRQPDIPPRSQLYSLEPVGVGTAYVECLTSYTARLAAAHMVTTRDLVKHQFLPLWGSGKLSSIVSGNFWSVQSRAINGVRAWAQDWTETATTLTLREDIFALTMLTWANVLPPRGLLRATLAWCPSCLQDWSRNGQEIYHPLLWQLNVVKICDYHHQLLESDCPDCGRQIPILSSQGRLGFCPYCKCWLGSLSDKKKLLEEKELLWNRWIVKAVGELIAEAPNLTSLLVRSRIAENISQVIEQTAGGKNGLFKKILDEVGLHVSVGTVYDWRHGKFLPCLKNLLQICNYLDITLFQFLTGEIRIPNTLLEARVTDEIKKKQAKSGKRITTADLDEMHTKLEIRLTKIDIPPLSPRAVAKSLGCSQKTFKRHFPREYQIISKQYQDHLQQKKQRLQDALDAVLEDDDCPPRSMGEVSKGLGHNHSHLLKLFPDKCKKISEKFKTYQKAQAKLGMRRKCDQVRQATFDVYAMGEYPSRVRVTDFLGISLMALKNKELKNAWRSAKQELGLI